MNSVTEAKRDVFIDNVFLGNDCFAVSFNLYLVSLSNKKCLSSGFPSRPVSAWLIVRLTPGERANRQTRTTDPRAKSFINASPRSMFFIVKNYANITHSHCSTVKFILKQTQKTLYDSGARFVASCGSKFDLTSTFDNVLFCALTLVIHCRHFADGIFPSTCIHGNCCILIKISLRFVP